MKFRLLVLLLYICRLNVANAQIASTFDAQQQSLGGIVAVPAAIISGSINPAELYCANQTKLHFSYQNRFLVPELNNYQTGIVFSLKPGNFAGQFSYFGYQPYHISHGELAYGVSLTPIIAGGMRMGFSDTRILATEVNELSLQAEIGWLIMPADHLSFGLLITNPWLLNSSTMNSVNTSKVAFGTAYNIPFEYALLSEISWSTKNKLVLASGIEYWIAKTIAIRFGIRLSDHPVYTFGLGIKSGHLLLALCSEQHSVLGTSAGLTLIYSLTKNE